MFVNFGSGKCPVCGDFARTMSRRIFHCGRCSIAFNDYYISSVKELEEYHSRYWN